MKKLVTHPIGPSPKHRWKVFSQNVDCCERCGTMFHRLADGLHGAFYCAPSPAWLAANPTDDGEER